MRRSIQSLCLTLAMGLLWPILGNATSTPLVFSHLDAAGGLPQNTVMATLQDSQGFVWFATEDGLARFDGYAVHRYGRDRDRREGLGASFIWATAEDSSGNLWVATKDGGVARWERSSDQFTSYRHDPADPRSLSSNATRALIIDRSGHVWVGTTGGGLNEIDPSTGTIRRYRQDPERDDSLASDVVTALHEDAKGTLWVGTAAGLQVLLRDSGTFRRYGSGVNGAPALSSQQVSSITSDRDGALWIGTYDGGLNRFDPEHATVTTWRAGTDEHSSLAADEVRAVLSDSAGRLWVGTSEGLHLMDRTGHLTRYVHDPAVPTSLPDNYVMSLYEDRSGLIWVGTRAAGVSRWNPRSWALGHQRPAWLGQAYVMSFSDDSAGRLWVGTLGNGLHLYDPQSGTHQTLDEFTRRRNSLPDPRVMSLLTDRSGNLWIGMMEGGLARLATDHTLQVFEARPGDPNALAAAGITSMLEARDGRIWLGTFGGGINILDPGAGAFQRISYSRQDPASISAPRVTALAQDAQGFVWAGTEGGGLNLLTADGRLLRVFRHSTDNPDSLSADTVYSLHVDAQRRIWIGTDGGGLDRVVGSARQPESIRFHNVAKADGLASDIVYGIRSDSSGKLWLSSNAGLSRYDPDTGSTTTYHGEQGLQGEEFNFGAHFRTRSGQLAFGGVNGFNLFDPLGLNGLVPPPRVVLTGVEVMNRPAQTPAPYPVLDSLELGYRDSVVAFEFAALNYAAPAKNRYQYRLSGFDPGWIDLGNRHRVSYTNLDSGDYVLEIRAATPDSPWSDVALTLPVKVEPAPWLTPWAKLLYALFAVLLVITLWRSQQRRLQLAARARERLEQEVAERTAQLRERNAELARVSRAKGDFLSRMSHEIRTPLNGVLGMAELLCRTKMSPRQAQLADTVRDSARSLLAILNEILDLAKVEAGKTALESKPFDLCDLLEGAVASLAPLAESKGLELYVSPPPEQDCRLVGDPQRLGQVVINLVANAIKFTERGEVTVRASLAASDAGRADVQITVKDTGIGMEPGVAERIFEAFSQADESTTRRYGGTGLGLSICREFVHLMGGSIAVDSAPGVGSAFTIRLSLPRAAAEHAPSSEALRGIAVRLSCRRSGLRESLERMLTAWGISVDPGGGDRRIGRASAEQVAADAWLIDVDSADVNLDALPRPQPGTRSPVVLLATSGTIIAQDLERRFGTATIVAKPLRRETLYRALAAAAGREVPAPQPTVEHDPAPLQRLTGHVLVAEDNAVNALVVEGMLAEIGCTAKVAADGREAVTQAVSEEYDLILMDLHMPEIDGLEAARRIRQATGARRVPIVALTASTVETHRDECLIAGMDDFLSKPFTLNEFHRVLSRLLPAARADGSPASIEAPPDAGLDESVLRGIRTMQRRDQPDLLGRVLSLYATNSHRQLADLRAAVDAGDLPAVARHAHSLKSSSANVGATEVARLALALERAGLDNDAITTRSLIGPLATAHDSTLVSLDRMLKEAAA